MDDRHHRIAVHPGDDNRISYLGWELRDAQAFMVALEHLASKGVTVHEGSPDETHVRHVSQMARFSDPAGYVHEIYWGARVESGSFAPGKPMAGRFVSGSEGVGHVGLVVPEITAELQKFAQEVLGFSMYAGTPHSLPPALGPHLQFYRCNPRTHSLVYLGAPERLGVHHLCVESDSLDDVGRAYDLVQDREIPVTLSLGRHALDSTVSFYARTPSGFDIEFGSGGARLDDDVFVQTSPVRSEVWGHRPVTGGWPESVRPVRS
jgi:extradiol dioxygenase